MKSSNYILAIETATSICSVAILHGNDVVGCMSDQTAQRHNETLPGMVRQMMSDNSINYSDLNSIAVSIGPGSFTGLRVGLSYAKGLALGCGLNIIPVETIQALALTIARHIKNDNLSVADKILICPLVVARKGEAFGRLYSLGNSQPKTYGEYFLGSFVEILKHIGDKKVIFGGEGSDKFGTELIDNLPADCLNLTGIKADAVSIGLIANQYISDDNFILPSLNELEPMYLKEFTITPKSTKLNG